MYTWGSITLLYYIILTELSGCHTTNSAHWLHYRSHAHFMRHSLSLPLVFLSTCAGIARGPACNGYKYKRDRNDSRFHAAHRPEWCFPNAPDDKPTWRLVKTPLFGAHLKFAGLDSPGEGSKKLKIQQAPQVSVIMNNFMNFSGGLRVCKSEAESRHWLWSERKEEVSIVS